MPSILCLNARTPVAQFVTASGWNSDDPGSNPGWITMSFFAIIQLCKTSKQRTHWGRALCREVVLFSEVLFQTHWKFPKDKKKLIVCWMDYFNIFCFILMACSIARWQEQHYTSIEYVEWCNYNTNKHLIVVCNCIFENSGKDHRCRSGIRRYLL